MVFCFKSRVGQGGQEEVGCVCVRGHGGETEDRDRKRKTGESPHMSASSR